MALIAPPAVSAPVVNAGLLYVNGLAVANSTTSANKQLILGAGQARDSTNVNDIILPQVLDNGQGVVASGLPLGAIINGLQVGANGCDQAPLAANSLYAVYVIASSNNVDTSLLDLGAGFVHLPGQGTVQFPAQEVVNPFPAAGLLSLASNAAPFLPEGYDMYRRVGWASTNGSANLIAFHQFLSNDQSRVYWYDVPRALGAATAGSTTYARAVLGAGAVPTTNPAPFLVPAKASQVYLNVSFTANAAGNSVQFAPYVASYVGGSAAGIVQVTGGVVSPAVELASIVVPYGLDVVDYPTVNPIPTPVVLYKTTSGSDVVALTVCGFLDLL